MELRNSLGWASCFPGLCSCSWKCWGIRYTDASMVMVEHESSQIHDLVPRHYTGRSGSRGNDKPRWEGWEELRMLGVSTILPGTHLDASFLERVQSQIKWVVWLCSTVSRRNSIQLLHFHCSHCLGVINSTIWGFFLLVWPLILNDETSAACSYKPKHYV